MGPPAKSQSWSRCAFCSLLCPSTPLCPRSCCIFQQKQSPKLTLCIKDWPALPNAALCLILFILPDLSLVSVSPSPGREMKAQRLGLTGLSSHSWKSRACRHGLQGCWEDPLLHNVTPHRTVQTPPPSAMPSVFSKMQILCGWSSGCERS